MNEPDDNGRAFRGRLAQQRKDCRHVTAEDILLDTLEELGKVPEGRAVRMLILWHTYEESNPDGPVQPHSAYANITKSRIIATLAAEQQEVVTEWIRPST